MRLRRESTTTSLGYFFFKNRSLAGLPVIAFCFIATWWENGNGMLKWAIGSLILILGIVLRLWAVKHLGRGARTYKTKVKTLVRSGPYAYVRNPIYVANITILAGFVAISGLLWMVPAAVAAAWGFYHSIVLWEESILRERFGKEAEHYISVVNRWIPSRCSVGLVSPATKGTSPMTVTLLLLFESRSIILSATVCSLFIARDILLRAWAG